MDLPLYLKALGFAIRRHGPQMRKDGVTPYVLHPVQVAEVLRGQGLDDPVLLAAALLHDTIEDTGTHYDELADRFGHEVARLVVEVTSDMRLPRPERRREMEEHAASLSPRARALKIADKIANLGDLAERPPEGWSAERMREYVAHAARVARAIRGEYPGLDALFERAYRAARKRASRASAPRARGG